jgi:ubiquitin-like modifier-activating enzyme ATG7
MDVLRLYDDLPPVSGSYAPGRTIRDRETGQEIDLGCHLAMPFVKACSECSAPRLSYA